MTYENLKAQVVSLVKQGRIPATPTVEYRANFAFGNTKLENEAVTYEMALKAAKAHNA